MSFGVTTTGFTRPALDEIISLRVARVRELIGPISTDTSSAIYQLIAAEAEREDRLWQALEAVYGASYPSSAFGKSLDGAVQLTGITRLAATKSFADVALEGSIGTLVPTGSQAKVVNTTDIFETTENVLLALTDMITANLTATAQNSATYSLTLGSDTTSITSGSGQSSATILQNLANAFDAAHSGVANFSLVGSVLRIELADPSTSLAISVSANITVAKIGTPARLRSLNTGNIQAPAGSLTVIETPVVGWVSVTNLVDAEAGREIETDVELRLRRLESLRVLGAATAASIQSRLLQEVADVSSVAVVENRTDSTDGDGRPPHSFETIVRGGTDQDVADKIWELKPAGIQTYGNTTVDIIDAANITQAINFTRPVDVYIWVKVVITLNGIGTWTDDGLDQVSENLVSYGESLGVGDNIKILSLIHI